MSATPKGIEEWLKSATGGLDRRIRQRLEVELTSHFEDAFKEYLAAGLSEGDAERKALEQLGDAKGAREVYGEEYGLEMPWQGDFLPKKLEGWEYGYVKGSELVGCTRGELIELCKCAGVNGREITLAWTPETEHVAPVETIPFLLEAIKAKRKKSAEWQMANGLLWGALIASPAFSSKDPVNLRHLAVFLGLAAGVPIFYGLKQWRAANGLTCELLAGEASESARRFQHWCGVQKAPLTIGLMSLCILVTIMQIVALIFEGSMETAALVQPAVWQGEWWRLLTCVFVHAGLMHLMFNLAGIGLFGNLVELLVGRIFLPVVFLGSALAGALCSLFLNPQASVGASGGILGLAGFLFVMAGRVKEFRDLPDIKSTVAGVGVFAAVTGIIAYDLFDSAAHLGGLLAGLGMGWAVRQPGKLRQTMGFRLSGLAASLILISGAVGAMALMTKPVPQPTKIAAQAEAPAAVQPTTNQPGPTIDRRYRQTEFMIEPRVLGTPKTCIDLEQVHNFHLKLHWQAPAYSVTLKDLPTGLQLFNGIQFDVRAGIQLAGTNAAAKWPQQKIGINIHQPAGRIHFLHGAGGVVAEGTVIGKYVMLLGSGREEEQPIVYGEHLREWHGREDAAQEVTAGQIAWSKPTCHDTRLYQISWSNPDPLDAVLTVSFYSAGTPCMPFVVGITVQPPGENWSQR